MSERIVLIEEAAETGEDFRWPGGAGCLVASGIFANHRLQLEMLGPDGVTFVSAPGEATLISPGAALFTLPQSRIRAAIFQDVPDDSDGGGGGTQFPTPPAARSISQSMDREPSRSSTRRCGSDSQV